LGSIVYHFQREPYNMNINLVTDAKYHNLALMRLSKHYKERGHHIFLNGVGKFELTFGSWLFTWSQKQPCDIEGGPGIDPALTLENQLPYINFNGKPDYSLFNLNYSLGYTWSYCPRKCPFCIVPLQNNPKDHHSIWEFHDIRFKEICLLNNNTFSDPQWRETFQEIWETDLILNDENGYDLRFLDDEKADALKRTKFKNNRIYFAWDRMQDEKEIIAGFEILKKFKLARHDTVIYVLVGFDTTEEEDFYRLQKIHDYGMSPYVMPFRKNDRHLYALKRFIDQRAYRQYSTIREAWKAYRYKE